MKIAITGSHGLIARHLIPELEGAGHQVLRVVRSDAAPGAAHWDPDTRSIDPAAHRQAVLTSRERGTSLLAERISESARPPRVFLSASAIGFYGDRGDEQLNEASGPGTGFLPEVCTHWESATAAAESAGVRTVHLRTGIVQAREGGALKPQLLVFKAGLGAPLGSGAQWVSWISIDDEVGAIIHALNDDSLSGALNLVAPNPVTNATYTAVLAKALHRPAFLKVPAAALRVALGRQMADELLLISQRVEPSILATSGYQWRHPDLEGALAALLR
jgi:uncharacterized protein (TIGR01777 family)